MKRRAKIDIPDCLISKGEIYEFFKAENGNYEVKEWKGNADGTKLNFPEFYMLENFEEIVEKTVELVSEKYYIAVNYGCEGWQLEEVKFEDIPKVILSGRHSNEMKVFKELTVKIGE
jgi:hypothetical protein